MEQLTLFGDAPSTFEEKQALYFESMKGEMKRLESVWLKRCPNATRVTFTAPFLGALVPTLHYD